MEPGLILHTLETYGVPYRLVKGIFVHGESSRLSPAVTGAIAQESAALAALVASMPPAKCEVCGTGKLTPFHVRLWLVNGLWIRLCPPCFADREKQGGLVEVARYAGYVRMAEDNGLCCFCNQRPASVPVDAPNLCLPCWKARTRAKTEGRG